MRKYQKYILLILMLLIGVSIAVLGKYYKNWNSKKIVSAAQMKAYGDTYLRRYEYQYLVQSKVLPPADQNYFSFLKDKPFLIKATISNSHGAAIEFVPSEKREFQSQNVADRIEQEIFSDKGPNIFRSKVMFYDHIDMAILNYVGTGALFRFGGPYELRGLAVNTPNGSFLEASETGSVLIKDLIVNSIVYPNAIIIKGSNHRGDWSRKVATEDALYKFESDSRGVYLNSEEFRKYLATPKLTQIANKIITKNKDGKYGEEYGPLEYEKDIAELIAVADAHGINHDYAMKIYTLLKEKPGWREKHWLIFYLILASFGAFWIWFFKWTWRKLNISQRFLLWWHKKKIPD